MGDFPGQMVLPAVISSYSQFAVGRDIAVFGGGQVPASAVWPAANRGIFVPFWLPTQFVLRSMFLCNGATAAGNIDLGVYTTDGALIVSKGATAQAGTSVPQILTMTATLPAGRYYMAASCSLGTATAHRNNTAALISRIGLLQAASQNPLATNPTFATMANAYMPLFGIASITTY